MKPLRTIMALGLWIIGIPARVVSPGDQESLAPRPAWANIFPRDQPGKPQCNIPNWDSAMTPNTRTNIDTLQHQGGVCNAGTHSIQRVACNWASGIYVTNDNSHVISPSCAVVADWASLIVSSCDQTHWGWPGQPAYHQVMGKVESNNGSWGVIVGKGDC